MIQILAIDAGTTGVTAVLFDGELKPIGRSYREFAQQFPQPGWVEHRAGDLLGAVDEVLHELLATVPGKIDAVGITNQRETVFAVDRSTGKALGNGIVWQDRRTAERCREYEAAGHGGQVRSLTGLLLDPYFSATKMQWLLEQRPKVADCAERGELVFLTVDSLVAAHLGIGPEAVTDRTNASRTMLLDIETLSWSPALLERFGVAPASLPKVLPSAAEYGMVSLPGGRTAPLTGIAGDQQAALFGQGCWDAGRSKITYGTGCFLVAHAGKERPEDVPGLLTTLAADKKGGPAYATEGSVFSGGLVIQWLRDGLGLIEQASESEALARSVPDTGGVHLIPAFSGLGAPYWDPDARAALLGLTRGTTRAHVARAALEAIAWQCSEILAGFGIEGSGPGIQVDGGATSNDLLMQMQADFSGTRVLRSAQAESTARGVAALAGIGAGIWDDIAGVSAFREPPEVFEVQLAASEREQRFQAWRAAVARVRTHAEL